MQSRIYTSLLSSVEVSLLFEAKESSAREYLTLRAEYFPSRSARRSRVLLEWWC
jgi:hypothetical protein